MFVHNGSCDFQALQANPADKYALKNAPKSVGVPTNDRANYWLDS